MLMYSGKSSTKIELNQNILYRYCVIIITMMNQEISKMSLLVVEDNKSTNKELVELLGFYFSNVISAIDGCDGVEQIGRYHPDIIISDIKMSCLDGIKMVRKVKNKNYKPIVILTTAFSDHKYLLEALDINVDAYLIKPIDIHVLMEKIKDNIEIAGQEDLRYTKLSKREYEVFIDLAKGIKASEIALKYNIKPKTVSTYRSRIFEKMSFVSNAELITYAVKNNLI